MDNLDLIKPDDIERRIVIIRNRQVMIDRDLADIYGVKTGRLNEQVKRNLERFPEDFCFQLTKEEFENWKSQNAISNSDKMGLRKKIEQLFSLMEKTDKENTQGIFYEGQIFDAYTFISDLVRKATKEIILIDNYVDDSVLKILNKRADNVTATIYTAHISENLKLDLEKHNSQYQPITIEHLNKSHDRFLIIDDDVYLIGGSIKDLGKKMSTFVKLSVPKGEFLDKILNL